MRVWIVRYTLEGRIFEKRVRAENVIDATYKSGCHIGTILGVNKFDGEAAADSVEAIIMTQEISSFIHVPKHLQGMQIKLAS